MCEFAIPKPGGEGREPRAEAAAARTPAAVGGSTVASQSARLAKALAGPRVVSIALRLGSGSCLCGSPIRIGEQGTSPNASKPRPAYKTAVAGGSGTEVSYSAEPTPDPGRSR